MKRGLRFACALLAVLGPMQLACNGGGGGEHPPASSPASAKGELFIADNALGSWIAINNTFAMPDMANRTAGTNYFWAGVLLQIGDYPAAPNTRPTRFEFDYVAFSKAGQGVHPPLRRSNDPAQIFWVNIVSKRDNAALPMDSAEVANLYPSSGADPCAGSTVPDTRCLRGMMIHGGMERVMGVVTYWQGKQGYQLETAQKADDQGNSYLFKLLDEFEVEIFDLSSGTPTSVGKYPVGAIDRIEVAGRVGPPSEGDKMDPPWPGK
jgi:hypothetical protein